MPATPPPVELRSSIPAPFPIRMLGVLVCALGVALIVGSVFAGADAMTIVGGGIAVAAGGTSVFARLTVVLTPARLRIRLAPFLSVELNRGAVRSASLRTIEPVALGGVGVRRVRGIRVVTMSAGLGVLLDTARGRILVQVSDPEQFVRAVESWRRGASTSEAVGPEGA